MDLRAGGVRQEKPGAPGTFIAASACAGPLRFAREGTVLTEEVGDVGTLAACTEAADVAPRGRRYDLQASGSLCAVGSGVTAFIRTTDVSRTTATLTVTAWENGAAGG